MSRLIFLNRFFYPDHSATSQILSDLAFHLAEGGDDVHVVTAKLGYESQDSHFPAEETVRNVKIYRVSMTGFGRSTLSGRAIDYLSFYRNMQHRVSELTKPGDILIAKTDPPLLSVIAGRLARQKRASLVNWLQDLYPEIAVALGVPFMRGPVELMLSHLRNRSLKSAQANVVLGQLMANKLQEIGISNLDVVPNWADDDEIRPLNGRDNPLRTKWGLQDKFVVGYSGNLGRAHEIKTVLQASEWLQNDDRIIFLTIGGGHLFNQLQEAVIAKGLTRLHRFLPYQDHQSLPQSLCVPDIHWLSLRPELEGLIVPSKFYGIAAAGKPMIVVSAKNGELANLAKQYQCGFVVPPGDGAGLAAIISHLADDPTLISKMGQRAREMLDKKFTRRQAFERWRQVFKDVRTAQRAVNDDFTYARSYFDGVQQ